MSRVCRASVAAGIFAVCALFAASGAQAQNGVKIEEKVPYLGTPNNVRMSNGTVELILTTDYGPRIMRYAFVGSGDDDNVFVTIPNDKPFLQSAYGDWYIRGGHRLWHSPEANPRSYVPDNDPIQYTIDGSTVKLIQPVEKQTQIQKEIWVTLDPEGSHVTVTHRLTNKGPFAVQMACWALTAMNRNGKVILPQEPPQSHDAALGPVRPLVMWSYTNLSDPRLMLGKSFITLTQDPNNKDSEKIGILNKQGWAAYARNGLLFLKRFAYDPDKTYSDFNVNNETYTDNRFIELESLGPLETVEPGATITHTENWWLFKNVDLGSGEVGIAAALQPILSATRKNRESTKDTKAHEERRSKALTPARREGETGCTKKI